jgi:hypothetical protein
VSVDLPADDEIFADLAGAAADLYRDDQLVVATELAGYARERLEAHRATGQSSIEITEGRVNVYVELVDPNAWAIEFVRRRRRNGEQSPAVAPMGYALSVLERS